MTSRPCSSPVRNTIIPQPMFARCCGVNEAHEAPAITLRHTRIGLETNPGILRR